MVVRTVPTASTTDDQLGRHFDAPPAAGGADTTDVADCVTGATADLMDSVAVEGLVRAGQPSSNSLTGHGIEVSLSLLQVLRACAAIGIIVCNMRTQGQPRQSYRADCRSFG